MRQFEESLQIGKVAEGLIAAWLQARGSAILPAYEIEKSTGKGPQLFSVEGDFVLPDMLAFSHKGLCWIEAKHKSVFTWHRISGKWTTGIDLRHYGEYFQVLQRTHLPVWLMFYHRESTPDQRDTQYGCPKECPTGLYGGALASLVIAESHRVPAKNSDRIGMLGHGYSGMVYWADDKLKLLATRSEVRAAFAHLRGAAA